MRWGLLGTGAHAANRIAPALERSETSELYAVAGSTPARAAEFGARFGAARAHDSYEAMLRDPAIEAVFVCTPNSQHLEQVCQAAAAGKHVLVEKPMALTIADAEAMIAACDRAGVRLGVGFQLRHHPAHRETSRMIAAGELGELVLLRGEWHTAYPPWTNWRADKAQAGADILAAVGVHVLDLLCFLAGTEPEHVTGLVDVAADTGLDQTAVATIRFAGGAIGVATITRRSRTPRNGLLVLGTEGGVSAPAAMGMDPAGAMTRFGTAGEHTLTFDVPDLYAAQFDSFVRDDGICASGEDGLRSVRLCTRLLAEAG